MRRSADTRSFNFGQAALELLVWIVLTVIVFAFLPSNLAWWVESAVVAGTGLVAFALIDGFDRWRTRRS